MLILTKEKAFNFGSMFECNGRKLIHLFDYIILDVAKTLQATQKVNNW